MLDFTSDAPVDIKLPENFSATSAVLINNIIVTTQFEATHFWKDCNIPEVEYLKNPHRHMFHVTIKMNVSHLDRDYEFIQQKRILNELLEKIKPTIQNEGWSCEMIANFIYNEMPNIVYVKVMEDNENGAELIVTHQ